MLLKISSSSVIIWFYLLRVRESNLFFLNGPLQVLYWIFISLFFFYLVLCINFVCLFFDCPDASPPLQAELRSRHPDFGWLLLCGTLLFQPLWPIPTARMVALECASKVQVFPSDFLDWMYLGKPTPGAVLNCQADLAIWTALSGACGSHSYTGPKSLSDCTLW